MITADSPGNGENQNITIIVDDSNGHHVISAPHPNVSTHNIVISVTNRPIKSVISFFYIITTCIRSLHLIHITKTQEMFRTMNLHINVFPSCLQDHNTPSGHLVSHHTHLLHGIAYLGSYSSNYSLQDPRNCPRTYY